MKAKRRGCEYYLPLHGGLVILHAQKHGKFDRDPCVKDSDREWRRYAKQGCHLS